MIDLSDAAIFGIRNAQDQKTLTRTADFRSYAPSAGLSITARLLKAFRAPDAARDSTRKPR